MNSTTADVDRSIPERRGYCLGCNHPLKGVTEAVCHEFGRRFDPADLRSVGEMPFPMRRVLARLARALVVLGGCGHASLGRAMVRGQSCGQSWTRILRGSTTAERGSRRGLEVDRCLPATSQRQVATRSALRRTPRPPTETARSMPVQDSNPRLNSKTQLQDSSPRLESLAHATHDTRDDLSPGTFARPWDSSAVPHEMSAPNLPRIGAERPFRPASPRGRRPASPDRHTEAPSSHPPDPLDLSGRAT